MVTDCLAPIISEPGVGTIVTLGGHSVLTDGLVFRKMEIETFYTNEGDHYKLALNDIGVRTKGSFKDCQLRLFVTHEVALLTPDGWQDVKELRDRYPAKVRSLIRVLKTRCMYCGKYYIANRPIQAVCSQKCYYAAAEAQIGVFKSVKKANLPDIIKEDWAELCFIIRSDIPKNIESVRVINLEGGQGVYVNGILISSKSLLNAVGSGYNGITE